MNAIDRDPFLDMDLDGLRLVEASAGTGKTYTIATLVTRLLIERGLRIEQILAVTFTTAATQELRERIRKRLLLAARIAGSCDGKPASAADVADSAYPVTRSMIESRLQHESVPALHARLQQAAHQIDLAAVHTIDSFCARVLSEHALEAGQPFVAMEMIGSDRELREIVATDLWRSIGSDPLDARLLQLQWSNPDALAKDLGELLRVPRVLPMVSVEMPDPLPTLRLTASALRIAFVDHGNTARALLQAALVTKTLNARNYSLELIDELWAVLTDWFSRDDDLAIVDARVDRLAPDYLASKTNKNKSTPQSLFFEAVGAYVSAGVAREAWLASRRIAIVHRIREQAATRLAALKKSRRVQSYSDLLDGVTNALDGPHGDVLVSGLHEQYAVALVDEFQDTDARQWALFERVFATRALFLIGDPKQAIYRFRGGDVHTYRVAAELAAAAPRLDRNHRSRPSLLRAVEALYAQAGEAAFVDPRIQFHPVAPADSASDTDYLRDGQPAAALTVRVLPATEPGTAWKADESRAIATRTCVAAILDVLRAGRDGRARINSEPVQPADIAVLVRSHREATWIREALAVAAIPAVAAGKQSLFATEQAQELLALFEALLRPDDEARLRAALATILLGLDAQAIDRLGRDEDWHRQWQSRALAWRARWEIHGPLALVSDLCAENAPRLLGLVDGERRLTNLLQLGESLQEADARALGMRGLLDWLRLRIADADADDETQQLRLESDARCVQIHTLHKSKGLEFPLVFLPFAGIGGNHQTGSHCTYHDGSGRVLHLKPAIEHKTEPAWLQASAQCQLEERAEEARLLYVGLTRAEHALWLCCGPLYQAAQAPLAAMLADTAALQARAAGDIVIDTSAVPGEHVLRLPPEAIGVPPPPRIALRVVRRDWWVYSFSMLAHDAGHAFDAGERSAVDEPDALPIATDPRDPDVAPDAVPMIAAAGMQGSLADARFSGVRFGNALHAALEQVDFSRWRNWDANIPPTGEHDALLAALRREGYADADHADGVRILCALIAATLNVRLPEGARLSVLAADARRAEMEFHFAFAPLQVDALLDLLHAHGLLNARHGFGMRRRIEGLMTGKIDMVYVHDGRFHVLDYKSNRLADYNQSTLAEAMRESEYDLQYLIYSLALHRWLRFRMGDAYDYDSHFGGVRYLFCRGLDAHHADTSNSDAPGIYSTRPTRALIEALDALFAADTRSAA